MNEFINVRDLGAKGNGIANDTTPIQDAIYQGSLYNLKIYIPEGNYLVHGLVIKSNTFIFGDGDKSIITQLEEEKEYAPYIFTIYDKSKKEQETITNVSISNLTLMGKVDERGFWESKGLINACGVDNLIVDNVNFIGFRGDGISLGGYVFINNVEPRIERHNSNVFITNCVFDGINKDNRNGISILDCDGLLINNCTFRNITRPDMPGAIDFEPDHDWCIVRNSTISKCFFENIGGLGAILILSPRTMSYREPYSIEKPNFSSELINLPTNFVIKNNIITDCEFVDFYGGGNFGAIIYNADYKNIDANLVIEKNIIKNVNKPLLITTGKNMILQLNDFYNCEYMLDIHGCSNISFSENNLSFCGKSGSALTLANVNDLDLTNNIFIDCGSKNGSAIMIFGYGSTMNNTIINNNTFSSPNKITSKAVTIQPNVIFSGYKEFEGNILNDNIISELLSDLTTSSKKSTDVSNDISRPNFFKKIFFPEKNMEIQATETKNDTNSVEQINKDNKKYIYVFGFLVIGTLIYVSINKK